LNVPGKLGNYVEFFGRQWRRSHVRALAITAILAFALLIGYTFRLVYPHVVEYFQNRVAASLKPKLWPGPWAPVMAKGDAKSWQIVRGPAWPNVPLDPAGNAMALKVTAGSLGFANLIGYTLGDYDADFTISLAADQESVSWIVRARNEKEYYAITDSFTGDVKKGIVGNHVVQGCLYRDGKIAGTCQPYSNLYFAPLQQNDSLKVNMAVRGFTVQATVTLERHPLLVQPPKGDMSNRPNELGFTIPDRKLSQGWFGFRADGPRQDFAVYQITLNGRAEDASDSKSGTGAK
jgi:hypothetical protein